MIATIEEIAVAVATSEDAGETIADREASRRHASRWLQ
jgi:hypothetical protein